MEIGYCVSATRKLIHTHGDEEDSKGNRRVDRKLHRRKIINSGGAGMLATFPRCAEGGQGTHSRNSRSVFDIDVSILNWLFPCNMESIKLINTHPFFVETH